MPMYEYACADCGKHTEIIQKFSDAPATHCPACGGAIQRVISPSAFVLKGGGWYKDGYASARPAAKDSGANGADKPKAKTDAPKTCERTGSPADTSCACAQSPTPKASSS